MNRVEFDNMNKNVNNLSEEEIKNKLYLNQLKPIYNWFQKWYSKGSKHSLEYCKIGTYSNDEIL